MNLAELGAKLPDQTIQWRGFGSPTLIDLNALTGEVITPESVFLESIAKLLEGIFQLQVDVNADRAAENKPPIAFVDRDVEVSATGNPVYVYTVRVEVNTQGALNNLVNPLES
ncbi:hypothetical protein LEP3755_01740 [Leptolyngbya sp. NIES-3755]|nr:hypothetical protein LEP3755_01740 [Leptolyngbya sp. NIES-3755]